MKKQSKAFELIMEGLQEARDYLDGKPVNVALTEVIITEVKSRNSLDVKKLREEIGYSQGVFAEALGVTRKTVESWESGRNTPSGSVLRLMDLIEKDQNIFQKYGVVKKVPKKAG